MLPKSDINAGWWLLKKHETWWSEFVSWDDDIPNMMGKIIQMFQITKQNVFV